MLEHELHKEDKVAKLTALSGCYVLFPLGKGRHQASWNIAGLDPLLSSENFCLLVAGRGLSEERTERPSLGGKNLFSELEIGNI